MVKKWEIKGLYMFFNIKMWMIFLMMIYVFELIKVINKIV